MTYYNPKRVSPPRVLPPLFGPWGRKWLSLDGLRARYKIAQGPEYHAEPSEPPKEPRKPAKQTAGDLNAPKPTPEVPYKIQERSEQRPARDPLDLGGIEDTPGVETVGGRPVYFQRQSDAPDADLSQWAETPEEDEPSDEGLIDLDQEIADLESDEDSAWGSPSEEELVKERQDAELSDWVQTILYGSDPIRPDRFASRADYLDKAVPWVVNRYIGKAKEEGRPVTMQQIRSIQDLAHFEAIFVWRRWQDGHKEKEEL